jgi:hypothetical protein
MTVFPQVEDPNHGRSNALDHRGFSTPPTINLGEVEDLNDFEDPKVRAYVEEERRISRLPAFLQDDCGDGELFPNIPLATDPEPMDDISNTHISEPSNLNLQTTDRSSWLLVDEHYMEMHEARSILLSKHRGECIYTHPDGEAASKELLHSIAEFLVTNYPLRFSYRMKSRRKHIQNEFTQEPFSLDKPFDYPPMETCARLCAEDFCIFIRDVFTRAWYLLVPPFQ